MGQVNLGVETIYSSCEKGGWGMWWDIYLLMCCLQRTNEWWLQGGRRGTDLEETRPEAVFKQTGDFVEERFRRPS